MPGKIFLVIIFSGFVAVTFLTVAAMFLSPAIATKKTLVILKAFGLETSLLPEEKAGWSEIVYNDVALDKDKISTIRTISTTFNPLTTLIFNRVGTVTFENLSLTDEWGNNLTILPDISGLSAPPSLSAIATLPAHHIRFVKSNISVLTPNFGGLSLTFDLDGTLYGDKMEFQSHLGSGQKYISFTAGADGIIAHNYSSIDLDISEAKFEVPDADIKASRINGTFNFSNDHSGTNKITAELQAGGINILGLPWQNASATIESANNEMTISIEAKSIGVEGLELTLTLQNTTGISGEIHADNGETLIAYLAQQKKIILPPEDIEAIKSMQDVRLEFTFEKSTTGERKIKYNLGDNSTVKEIIL